MASKVPEVTVLFWTIKICTTGMGEAASDFMGSRPLLLAAPLVLLAGLALVVALVKQFRAEQYVPWIYWSAVAMVSVFGTVVADGIRNGLGISYVATTIVFSLAVLACLGLWYRSEGTLSIHSITTRRREIFYWSTVVSTFALGTAAGDLTATKLGFGFLQSGFFFAVVIAIPLVAHVGFKMNAVLAFWWAYIITRPLGASFADWAAVPKHSKGLAFGTGPVSGVLIVVIVGLLVLESRRYGKVQASAHYSYEYAPIVERRAEFDFD